MGSVLKIQVLGPVQVWARDRRIMLAGPRSEALLATLVLGGGREVSTEVLIESAWDGDVPATVRRQVRNRITEMRRVLVGAGFPPEIIATQRNGFTLSAQGIAIDLLEYRGLAELAQEHKGSPEAVGLLRAALAQWNGPAFAGLETPRLTAAAAQLMEHRLALWEQCLELEIAAGNHRDLIAELSNLHTIHPTHEPFAKLLMLAYYRGGRQADALATYTATKRHLAEEFGISPGEQLQQMYEDVLRNNSRLLLPVRATFVVPRNLPSIAGNFVGRSAELAWLDDNAGAGIAVLSGMPGVGKTALAIRWAYAAAGRYQDGQIYLNLRGFGQEPPLTAVDAIGQVLRTLGTPAEKLPLDYEAAVREYRAALTGKEMIILLDNALSAEHVRPLLPGSAATAVVVISRNKLTGLVVHDGARQLMLDVLADDEAERLVIDLVGTQRAAAEPSAARQLASYAGNLPLGLRIAAAYLADRPQQSVGGYIAALKGRSRLADLSLDGDEHLGVEAVFAQSYEALTARQQRSLAALSALPANSFGGSVLAALLELPEPEAEEILRALETQCLIREHGVQRYTFHDLIRAYAAKKLSNFPFDEHDKVRSRLVGYFSTNAERAVAQLGDPQEAPEAMAWLESERSNLVGAVVEAARSGRPDAAYAIVKPLWRFFHRVGHLADWIVAYEATLKAMDSDDADRAALSHVLNYLGGAYIRTGRYPEAIAALERCLVMREQSGDLDGFARTHANLSMIQRDLGQHRRGLWHTETAIAACRASNNRTLEVNLIAGQLANGLLEVGEYQKVLDQTLHLLPEVEQRCSGVEYGSAVHNVAHAYFGLGDHVQAIHYFQAALKVHEQYGDKMTAGNTLGFMALLHRETGRLDEALDLHVQAIELVRQHRTPAAECQYTNEFAATYLAAGDLDNALLHFRAALDLATQVGSTYELARAHVGMGKVLRRTDAAKAKQHLLTALESLDPAHHGIIADIEAELARHESAAARQA
jgi:DNA-binding SARP family transcriptional activator